MLRRMEAEIQRRKRTGKRRAEGHGVDHKQICFAPAPVVAGLLKIVPELER